LNLGAAVVSGVISADYPCDRAFRTLLAPSTATILPSTVLRGGVLVIGWFVDNLHRICVLAG
jgi:hypothetical protein